MSSAQNLLGIAILPVAILLFYIYKKDPHKESFGSLFKIFILGVLSTIPAALLETIIDLFTSSSSLDKFSLFIYVFIGVALVEEFFKWIIIKLFIYKSDKFDEYYDAVVYCTFVSLGFASLENIGYVIGNGFATGIMRALTSVPGHTCFGIIMGYYLCYTKFNDIRGNKEYNKYNLYSLFFPVLGHTLYDFLILAQSYAMWIIFYIFLLIYCIKLINKVAKLNQPFYVFNTNTPIINPNPHAANYQQNMQQNVNQNAFCPNCGNSINGGNFCPRCGNRL